jgi:hypothetical protein
MRKFSIRKLELAKETLRSLDGKMEKIVAGAEECPTLHCTDPAYGCTNSSCDLGA